MSYRNKTYVIFDGDNDRWAYAFMKGWKSLENVDFNFIDAHDLKPLSDNASEDTVYKRLRERLSTAKQVVVLVGKTTKNLYKFVRWELEMALKLDLPIIVVNLNDRRSGDDDLCPAILRDKYIVHVPFKKDIIQYALDNFPGEYGVRDKSETRWRHYNKSVYDKLEL